MGPEPAASGSAGSRQSTLRAVKGRLRQAWPQTQLLGEKGARRAPGKINLTLKKKMKTKSLEMGDVWKGNSVWRQGRSRGGTAYG